MTTYCYDLHVHTNNTSRCGKVAPHELVQLYHQAGFAGIVITDHFHQQFFRSLWGLSWTEKIDRYVQGSRLAAAEAKRLGLLVLMGAEITFNSSPNDYLLYGEERMLDTFLRENPELYRLSLVEFTKRTHDAGLLLFQAHPFRPLMERVPPKLLDGVEVFNGNPRHNSDNQRAWQYAQEHQLLMVSGSDFHQPEDLGRGGMVVEQELTDGSQLISLLRSRQFVSLLGQGKNGEEQDEYRPSAI